MSSWAVGSWAAWFAVVAVAAFFRSRPYAIFLGVILGLYTLIAIPLLPTLAQRLGPLGPLVLYLHGSAYLHWLLLAWPRLRPLTHRLLVSYPGMYMSGSVLLAFPWAIAAAFGLHPWGMELPFVLGAVGLFQSITARTESHHIEVGTPAPHAGIRRGSTKAAAPEGALEPSRPLPRRPLRLVQITDPHLGPFMSVERLQRVCRRAVEEEPDLILLTGDFLTMESQSDERWLTEALAPLAAAPGRVFACLGNHDHEAPLIVRRALASAGVTLLVDDARLVETAAGPVQIVGFDFVWRDRAEHMARVCASFPRAPGALRLALLHDPGAFRHLPEGEADLVLSGHTHGGQLGLVSLHLPWTVVSSVAKIPDHGLWERGTDRLYVHRGNGHYGFPLRLGVPAEESVLHVYFPTWSALVADERGGSAAT